MPDSGFLADRARVSSLAALACCALLAAAALWLLARLALSLWSSSAVVPASGTRTINVRAPASPVSVVRFHLFGITPPRAGSNGPGAPASTTGLILRGTLADRDPKAGVAVLDGAGNGERSFRAGEDVLPGVRLVEVHADHIVLSRGGVQETLRLVRDTNLDPTNVVRPTPGIAKGSATVSSATRTGAGNVAVPAAPVSSETQRTSARLRANPAELAQHVQIMPVLDNGKLAGVRVSASGEEATLLAQAGLQPGDTVIAVDGQRIDSIERGQQIVTRLGSASSARVTVLRNGKTVDLTVALR
ncbi:type II secretion system protein N [Dokdonella sp.]|uniref:type II secretion system protein N n=1 Tax=Dokdonella sp. TaxID=2291710 RepID=UPI0025BD03A8|nr:type II secretion system protein N [Dokdonella sp.]MBX3687803.1 PDZ domain-containing protein [Dokdonella sp.]